MAFQQGDVLNRHMGQKPEAGMIRRETQIRVSKYEEVIVALNAV